MSRGRGLPPFSPAAARQPALPSTNVATASSSARQRRQAVVARTNSVLAGRQWTDAIIMERIVRTASVSARVIPRD